MTMEERQIEKQRRERQKLENKSDFKNAANLSNTIGALLSELGRYEEAIKEHQHELFLCETLNDQIGIAVANRKIGECYSDLGKFDEALKYVKKYLHISENEDNQQEIQRALATIGRTYLCQAEASEDHRVMREPLSKAKKAFIQSLESCEKLRKEVSPNELANMKARLCLNMGIVYDKLYKVKKALECFNRGVSLALEHRLHEIVAMCRKCQAGASQKLGDFSNAIKVYDAALKYAESTKDALSQAEILTQKAMIYLHLKDMFAAKKSIKKAYKLKAGSELEKDKIASVFKRVIVMEKLLGELKELDESDHEERLRIYESLGDHAAEVENYIQAVDFYMQMLKCALADGKEGMELEKIYESIASTYHDAGQFLQAVDHYKKKLDCVKELPGKTLRTYLSMAETMEVGGEPYDSIEEVYTTTLHLAKSTGDIRAQVKVLKALSSVQTLYRREEKKGETDEELSSLLAEHDVESEEEMSEARDSEGLNVELDNINLDRLISDDDATDDEEFDRPKQPASVTGRIARRKARTQFKRNEKGEYPLHIACIDGSLEKARALISQGHPINPRDHCGWIPLHEASNHNQSELVELLLDHGAWINDRGGRMCQGVTPLHDACSNGCMDVIKLLVARGANVHIKNDEGETALESLITYRKSCKGLRREELVQLKVTEDLLRDTLKGNNPHLSQTLTSKSTLSTTVLSDDDLPTIRHRPRARHGRTLPSTRAVRSRSPSPVCNSDDENDLENTIIREYEESQERESQRRSSSSFSGKRRRTSDTDDSDSDLEDMSLYRTSTQLSTTTTSHPNSTPTSTSAKNLYQATIASMRRSAVSSHSHPSSRFSKPGKKGPALVTDNDFVGDDWLIDDVGDQRKPAKRKRTDVEDIFTTTGTRRVSGGRKRASSENPTAMESLDDDQESSQNDKNIPDTIPSQSRKRISYESSTRVEGQEEEEDFSYSIDPFSQAFDEPILVDDMIMDDFDDHDNFPSQEFQLPPTQPSPPPPPPTHTYPPSSFSSSRAPASKPRQTKLTNFGLTKQTTTPASNDYEIPASIPMVSPTPVVTSTGAVRPMRLTVRIQDKLIRVPVANPDGPISVLASLAADRYKMVYGVRPRLSVSTGDGAVLPPDDLISALLADNELVEGLVEGWDLAPLPERYQETCTKMKSVMYRNVKRVLSDVTSSLSLELSNLSLRPAHFSPISTALQCQDSLREIHLNGNRLGDEGFASLCKVLHTLPNVRLLDVSCNQISGSGLKSFSTIMDQPGHPLQALENLDLSFNSLGDSCTKTLAVIVSKLTGLLSLRLRSCELSLKFFHQHRLQLAEALQKISLNHLDMAYNTLGSTGVELLLKTVRVSTLGHLDLTATVSSYTSNHLHKHLYTYLLDRTCSLTSLTLDNCYIHSDMWPDIVNCVAQSLSLERLSLCTNPKIQNHELGELLDSTSHSDTSKLNSLTLNGCSVESPISTALLDGINDKLNHTYPLNHLEFTSAAGVNPADLGVLRDIWQARWLEEASVKLSDKLVILSTTLHDK